MVINIRTCSKQAQQEVVDVPRWHRCTHEVERDLNCGSEGAEGEQFYGGDESGRIYGWVGPLGPPWIESRGGSERDHAVGLPTAERPLYIRTSAPMPLARSRIPTRPQ